MVLDSQKKVRVEVGVDGEVDVVFVAVIVATGQRVAGATPRPAAAVLQARPMLALPGPR
jgi:hypothetical protein